jgi:hypothetical protein
VREQIRWLVQHKMVDVLVTTAGGIEEDFIKCMGHTYMGDFQLKGEQGVVLAGTAAEAHWGSSCLRGGAADLDRCHWPGGSNIFCVQPALQQHVTHAQGRCRRGFV